MLKIYAFKFNNKGLTEIQFNKLMGYLSPEEQDKAVKFKNKHDTEVSLVSRYLIRKTLSSLVGIDAKKIKLTTTEYGKPVLLNRRDYNFDFNLSHSGDWIVWCIGQGTRVGLDVEEIKPIDIAIANDCFAEQELEYLNKQRGRELENFYKIWTLKESFVKAIGEGLSHPLKSFYFNFKQNNNISINIQNSKDCWYFKIYDIDPGYNLAVCSKKNIFPSEIKKIKLFD